MNYKQLNNLNQLTETTLIVGTDVSKEFHVARAQDFRGIELGKSIKFDNDIEGYRRFEEWFKKLMAEYGKTDIVIGMEPTGPYWLTLVRWLIKNEYRAVMVNPAATKKAKELDDNNQAKTDYRDARVIAQLVKDGRFTEPTIRNGFYEELKNTNRLRRSMVKDLTKTKNRIVNWLDRYFPEYRKCCSDWESVTLIWMLKRYKLPSVIANLEIEEVFQEIKKEHPRGIGRKKLKEIIDISKESVGIDEGIGSACWEFDYLMKQYEGLKEDIEGIEAYIDELTAESVDVRKIMEIKGIGLILASGLISEYGDIRQFESPKQMRKVTGLSLVEDSSGKKKGQMVISKRGRPKARHILYQCVLIMISKNKAFKALYEYYTKRNINPLTGKEAIVALMNKLIRIIHTIITKDVPYDEEKMMKDIIRPEQMKVVY